MIALNPVQFRAIAAQVTDHVIEIRVGVADLSIADGEVLVTLDAGYGTRSFYVDPDGTTRAAGLGVTLAPESAA
jgi:hypothetical protein